MRRMWRHIIVLLLSAWLLGCGKDIWGSQKSVPPSLPIAAARPEPEPPPAPTTAPAVATAEPKDAPTPTTAPGATSMPSAGLVAAATTQPVPPADRPKAVIDIMDLHPVSSVAPASSIEAIGSIASPKEPSPASQPTTAPAAPASAVVPAVAKAADPATATKPAKESVTNLAPRKRSATASAAAEVTTAPAVVQTKPPKPLPVAASMPAQSAQTSRLELEPLGPDRLPKPVAPEPAAIEIPENMSAATRPSSHEAAQPKVMAEAKPAPTALAAETNKPAAPAPAPLSPTPVVEKPRELPVVPLDRPLDLTELVAGPKATTTTAPVAATLPAVATSQAPTYSYPQPRPGTSLGLPPVKPAVTAIAPAAVQTSTAKPSKPVEGGGLTPLGPPGGVVEAVKPAPKPKPTPQPTASVEPKPKPARPTRPEEPPIAPTKLPPLPPKPVVYNQPEIVAASGLEVDGKVITVDDVLLAAAPQLSALPTGVAREDFQKRARGIVTQAVYRLRDRRLTLAEAKSKLTEDQTKQIDEQLKQAEEEMLAGAGGSRSNLQQKLAEQGTTLEDYQAQQRDGLVVQAYLHTMLMPAITINRQMLLDYYQQNHSKYAQPDRVQMQIIGEPFEAFYPPDTYVPTPGELAAAKALAKKNIQQAASALAGGEDFGAVARRLSRDAKASMDGLWPAMPRGSFRESAVEEAAFAQQSGQTSGIIETAKGYYIVRTAKLQAGQSVSFEQAQKEIEQTLREQQFNQLAEEYYQRIQKKATVVIPPAFIEIAVQQAEERFYKP